MARQVGQRFKIRPQYQVNINDEPNVGSAAKFGPITPSPPIAHAKCATSADGPPTTVNIDEQAAQHEQPGDRGCQTACIADHAPELKRKRIIKHDISIHSP